MRTPPRGDDHDRLADCERSEKTHVSKTDPHPWVVLVKQHKGNALAATKSIRDTSRGLPLNALQEDINHALRSSLGSVMRYPYGTVSFMETDFMLETLSQFLGVLKVAGIRDRPLRETGALSAWVDKGLGRSSEVRTVTDLATLTTAQLARDLNVSESDARKARGTLLQHALSELDPTTVPRNARVVNPILDRLNRAFPEESLRRMEQSAHPAQPRQPARARQSAQGGWFWRLFGKSPQPRNLERR
jgi:hypothetical protein